MEIPAMSHCLEIPLLRWFKVATICACTWVKQWVLEYPKYLRSIFQFRCCLNPKGMVFFGSTPYHPFSSPKGRSRYKLSLRQLPNHSDLVIFYPSHARELTQQLLHHLLWRVCRVPSTREGTATKFFAIARILQKISWITSCQNNRRRFFHLNSLLIISIFTYCMPKWQNHYILWNET